MLQGYQNHWVKQSPCKCEVFKRKVRFLGHVWVRSKVHYGPSWSGPSARSYNSWGFKKNAWISLLLTRIPSKFLQYSQASLPAALNTSWANPTWGSKNRKDIIQPEVKVTFNLTLPFLPQWTQSNQETLTSLLNNWLSLPSWDTKTSHNLNFSIVMPPRRDLGAVLYQNQNNKMAVIRYSSRTLTPPKRNYHLHSGKLEFLLLKYLTYSKWEANIRENQRESGERCCHWSSSGSARRRG